MKKMNMREARRITPTTTPATRPAIARPERAFVGFGGSWFWAALFVGFVDVLDAVGALFVLDV